MREKPIELKDGEKEQLEEIIYKGSDWHVRDRAKMILMLSEGHSAKAVAAEFGMIPEWIRQRRRLWRKYGFASLPDQPRCGAPIKLNDNHRKCLVHWVESEPLTCRELLSRLKTEFELIVSAGTLRSELKRLGYVWKRTRYSLKKTGSETF